MMMKIISFFLLFAVAFGTTDIATQTVQELTDDVSNATQTVIQGLTDDDVSNATQPFQGVDSGIWVKLQVMKRKQSIESLLRGNTDKAGSCKCDNGVKAPCGADCCEEGDYCDPGSSCCGADDCSPDGSQCCEGGGYCDPGYDCCEIATQGIMCVPLNTCGTPQVSDETVHQVGEIIGKICGPFGC